MKFSPEMQLVADATDGKRLINKLSADDLKQEVEQLFDLIVELASEGRYQIELLTQINRDLCEALKTGDDDYTRSTVDQLISCNPLPISRKL